jgi:hypothetical protein
VLHFCTARILQDGYAFINLNPFEVLQLTPAASEEDIKVRYRKVRRCSVCGVLRASWTVRCQ